MENNIVLYQHIRLDTNEVFYIGIGSPERAYIKTKRNKYWHNIVKKAGYKVEIISKNMSWQEACGCEKYLIAFYGRKNNTDWGTLVNMTDGGEGAIGRKHSTISKEKMSIVKKGITFTEEHRKKLSEARKGKEPANKGKSRSEETKKKISETLKGKYKVRLGSKVSADTKKRISETLKKYYENRKNLQQDK